MRPEAGVGAYAHEVDLGNLYDAERNPLGLWNAADKNAAESAILDAGFDGYFTRTFGVGQGAAVILGDASHDVAARPIATPGRPSAAPASRDWKTYTSGLTAEQAQQRAQDLGAKPNWAGYDIEATDAGEVRYRPREALTQRQLGTFDPRSLTIVLNENANFSTFLHESGHFFLEVLMDLGKPGGPQSLVDDANTVLAWAKVTREEWDAMGAEYRATGILPAGMRAVHEKWAESFELYLFEGKSPNVEMRGVFRRFRTWLVQAYRSMADFMRGKGLELSDDVRSVMDRMIATDEQIAQAEAAAGMLPDFDATNAAIEKLQTRSLRDMGWVVRARAKALRALQTQAKLLRRGVEDEVRAEVEQMPEYQARAAVAELRKSTPEHKAALAEWKAARKAVVDAALADLTAGLLATEGAGLKGLKKAQLLAANKARIANEAEGVALTWEAQNPVPDRELVGGPDIEAKLEGIAAAHGYDSVDAMSRAIADFGRPADVIAGMTDQRMIEQYGELATPEALEEAANDAVHNEARARALATELKAQSEALNPREQTGTARNGRPITVNALMAAAKQFAEDVAARKRVRDLGKATNMHRNAEARAGKAWEKATAAGKTAEAVQAKRDQMLNNRTVRALMDARDDVEKLVAYFKKFDSKAVREKLPPEYLEQIDALLERIDLRQVSGTRIDRRASLRAWVESQRAMGIDPVISDELMDDARLVSFKEMSVEELRGLGDAVKNIEHLGRLKGKLLAAKDKREFDIIANEIADSIRENGGKQLPVRLEPQGRVAKFFKGAWAEHRKLNSLIHQMDGDIDNGPFYRALIRSMNEAGANEDVKLAQATIELAKLFAPIEKLPGGFSGAKLLIPAIGASLSRGGRLAVALNWGNAQNRQRVMDGDGWTEVQVGAILATLSPVELKFVNDVWSHIDSYWAEIKAKQMRVSGVVEEKVVAEPFETTASDGTTVQMRGGYYPIKYDSDRSARAEKHEALERATEIMRGAVARPTTRRGHTKARVEEVKGRPVRKDLSVITQHVNQVAHDLAWHEWFIDATRLINDSRIHSAIRDHYGAQTAKTMKDAMEAIAVGNAVHQGEIDQLLLTLRGNVSRSIMGVSMTTALLQPFGLTQSMARIGVVPVLKGAARWAGDASRMESSITWIREKSPFMRRRATTFNRELREINSALHGKWKITKVTDAALFWTMQKMQLVADVPTWIGQYEKALNQGLDDATAVALADEAVLASQGGGTTKDLSAVQRNLPFLTQFYSYFNTTMNLVAEKTAATDFKNPRAVAGWLGDMTLLVTIPAILPMLITHLMKGGDVDDPEEVAKKMLEWQASYMFGMFVGLRELPVIWSPFDYAGPPAARLINEGKKLVQQAAQGDVDDPAVLAAIGFLGTVLGLPTTQIIRSYRGWLAWDEGEGPITSILMGPPPRD